MDLKVDIDPVAIEKMITDAVINSALGEKVKAAVADQYKKLSGYDYEYRLMVDNIIKEEIRSAVTKIVTSEFRDKIKDLVAAKITAKFVEELVGRMWERYYQD